MTRTLRQAVRAGLALSLAALPSPAAASCLLCADAGSPGVAATGAASDLRVEVGQGLRFQRVALAGARGGEVELDARSGAAQVRGGAVDLGGLNVTGRARVTGSPGRPVRIDLPRTVMLVGRSGGRVELCDLKTDLPPRPRLDAGGVLEFSFGGTIELTDGAGGDYRGAFPISADYE